MKKLLITLAGFFAIVPFSCKKNANDDAATLSLIQHKWMVVSINGEVLRYVGTPADYYNFDTDKILYEYVHDSYDTFAYSLQSGNHTLALYPIVNGVKSNTPASYEIKVLNDSQFIFGNSGVPVVTLDSLKR